MSYVTHILVHGADQKQIDALNEWLLENDPDRQQQLLPISMEAAGGTKVYCCDVWAAAFNYMPSEFRAKLLDPETWGFRTRMVSVLIDDEEVTEVFGPDSFTESRSERDQVAGHSAQAGQTAQDPRSC